MQRRFKLEKILEYRNIVLDREKMKLIELNNDERMLVMKMLEVLKEINKKNHEQEADAAKGDFMFADLYNKYIIVKEAEYRTIEFKRRELLKRIEEQKKVVKKSLNDVKIMEKLKEKHKIAYGQFMKKQEELQIDETNITHRHFE